MQRLDLMTSTYTRHGVPRDKGNKGQLFSGSSYRLLKILRIPLKSKFSRNNFYIFVRDGFQSTIDEKEIRFGIVLFKCQ